MMTDPEFIMLAKKESPRNPNLAIDRYVDGAWVRWSTSRLEEGHIWRYSIARSIPERCDVAPSRELLARASTPKK